MRAVHKDPFLKKHNLKLGFMSAFVKAAAFALQDQPVVNAGGLRISPVNVAEWGKADGQVHGRANSLGKQVKCAEKGGTVLHAAADFANATYVGRVHLAKRGPIRKGLPGVGLGLCIRSPQREEPAGWCRGSCRRCDAVPGGLSKVLAQTQKRITKGLSEGN